MQRLYIFVGKNKDVDGECRRAVTAVAGECGAVITEDIGTADVMIALGGDGTIMRAAHLACAHKLPVIGVNLGRIGYMAELDKSEISLIKGFFNGEYKEEERMLLNVKANDTVYQALNDAVFHSQNKHMCKYILSCDGNTVNDYRGDGLIIATPTGSTAYSTSAGGSVIDPKLECISVTPICPQSLTVRPMVFSSDNTFTVTAQSDECMMTVDGGTPIALKVGDSVTVEKSELRLRMIRLKNCGFYEVLRNKTV